MYESCGIALPSGIFPAVHEIEAHEVFLIHLRPDVNEKVVQRILSTLKEWAEVSNKVDVVYEPDPIRFSDVREHFKWFQKQALHHLRPIILFHHTRSYASACEEHVDVSFHLLPGENNSINVQLGKLRRPNAGNLLGNFNHILNIEEVI